MATTFFPNRVMAQANGKKKLHRGGRLCRHCALAPATRPRALCWKCYYTGAIRLRYPPLSRQGEYGARREDRAPRGRTPAEPTDALPGTPEKLRVIQLRVARGEDSKHPRDARVAD